MFPTHDASTGGMAALLTGVLENRAGCLYVTMGDGGGSYLVIWPATVSLGLDALGTPTLFEEGRSLGKVGDTLRVGGGEFDRSALPPEAGRCPGLVWLASEMVQPES